MNPMRLGSVAAFVLSMIVGRAVWADSYAIDGVHSMTVFRIHHFNAGYTYGLIGGPSGTFEYDPADPSKLAFNVSVSLDHLDTQSDQRDADIKGPDWFNAKQFPTIYFKSTSVKKTAETTYEVTGDLTLHGVTKSITVTMEMTGSAQGMRGETRTGFETTFSIKRSDYGMAAMVGPVGDDVRLIVALEGIKQ